MPTSWTYKCVCSSCHSPIFYNYKKKPPSIYYKKKQKEKAHQDISSIQNDEASVCVQTAVGKEPVFAGVYGVLGLRPMGLPNSPALCHYSRVLLLPPEVAMVDNSI
jgi:hypothetical protein